MLILLVLLLLVLLIISIIKIIIKLKNLLGVVFKFSLVAEGTWLWIPFIANFILWRQNLHTDVFYSCVWWLWMILHHLCKFWHYKIKFKVNGIQSQVPSIIKENLTTTPNKFFSIIIIFIILIIINNNNINNSNINNMNIILIIWI